MLTIEQFQSQHPDCKTRCRLIGPLRIAHRCEQCEQQFEPDAFEFIAYPPIRQRAIGIGKAVLAIAAGIPVAVAVMYVASYVLDDLGHVGAMLVIGLGGIGLAAMGAGTSTKIEDVLAKCPNCGSDEIRCIEPEKMGDSASQSEPLSTSDSRPLDGGPRIVPSGHAQPAGEIRSAGRRRLLLYALVVAALMVLFPPWLVQESQDRGHTFGPQHAAGYAFIGTPPSGYVVEELHPLGPPSGPYVVARLDYGRLLLQYIAIGTLFGGLALVCSPRLRKASADEPAPAAGKAPWSARAGAAAAPAGGAIPRQLHQLTAFLVLWVGHTAITDVHSLMSLGELNASDFIALFTEGFIYAFLSGALLAPFIYWLTRGTFKGSRTDGLLLASGAVLVVRVVVMLVAF